MALKKGDSVPHFLSQNIDGSVFDSQEIIGKKPVVIYFYPKDYTPGCTAQACGLRDQYEDFKLLGAEVIGISSDSIESHANFKNKYQLPFILLSDTKQELRNLFGVTNDLFFIPGRTTYIVNKQGLIVAVIDHMMASKHVEQSLALLQNEV